MGSKFFPFRVDPFSEEGTRNLTEWHYIENLSSPLKVNTVKPVLVVTSIKQPTCIKQPEESCPEIHTYIFELY